MTDGTIAGGEELRRFLERHPDVGHVDAVLVDLCGIVRGKRYPRADLEKLFQAGFAFPYSVFLLDVTGANTDACGRGFSDGDPDGVCLPVTGSLAPTPWAQAPAGQVLVSMYDADGRPALVDPRHLVGQVIDKLAALGLRPCVAFELEFHLLDADGEPGATPRPAISPLTGARDMGTQVYGIQELDGFAAFFRELEAGARAQALPASVATSEYGAGQYEVNLRHVSDPLQAADHCALFRHLAKSMARRHRMRATFMSKPFPGETGNGMHLHVSLLDDNGVNVFADEDALGSATLGHAVGGLMATMADAMAVFAPNVNAYRRFGPNLYVPVNKTWGANNRSVAFRVPSGAPDSRRIEHRVAGADANPYLTLAVVLAGIHHGIVERLDPGAPAAGSACEKMDPDLPTSWPDALDRFAASTIMASYLGAEYVELYAEIKRAELSAFSNYISPREYDWYL